MSVNNNSFCSGCGCPNFNNEALCRSCTSEVLERGFSSLEDFADWHELESERPEASEFDYEVAAKLGESHEEVIRHGFQPRAFEAEVPMDDVDRIFLEDEKRLYKQFGLPADFLGDLGA